MSFSTQAVANKLKSLGVKARMTGTRDEVVDGEIELPNNYHIQVGSHHLSLNQMVDIGKPHMGCKFGESRSTEIEVFQDIANVPELTTPQLTKYIAASAAASSN